MHGSIHKASASYCEQSQKKKFAPSSDTLKFRVDIVKNDCIKHGLGEVSARRGYFINK